MRESHRPEKCIEGRSPVDMPKRLGVPRLVRLFLFGTMHINCMDII